MKREIKFRVWDNNRKSWLTPDDYIGINNHGVIVNDREDMYDLSLHYNAIIQQYTGLKDENGKEIYEGDIVKYHLGNPDVYWIDVVAWQDYGWHLLHFDDSESGAVSVSHIYNSNAFLEVIGNTLENPELKYN